MHRGVYGFDARAFDSVSRNRVLRFRRAAVRDDVKTAITLVAVVQFACAVRSESVTGKHSLAVDQT